MLPGMDGMGTPVGSGLLGLFGGPQGLQVNDFRAPDTTIRISGAAVAGAYPWVPVLETDTALPDDASSFAVPSVGLPAYEVNGRTDVPVGTKVRAWLSPSQTYYLFEQAAGEDCCGWTADWGTYENARPALDYLLTDAIFDHPALGTDCVTWPSWYYPDPAAIGVPSGGTLNGFTCDTSLVGADPTAGEYCELCASIGLELITTAVTSTEYYLAAYMSLAVVTGVGTWTRASDVVKVCCGQVTGGRASGDFVASGGGDVSKVNDLSPAPDFNTRVWAGHVTLPPYRVSASSPATYGILIHVVREAGTDWAGTCRVRAGGIVARRICCSEGPAEPPA